VARTSSSNSPGAIPWASGPRRLSTAGSFHLFSTFDIDTGQVERDYFRSLVTSEQGCTTTGVRFVVPNSRPHPDCTPSVPTSGRSGPGGPAPFGLRRVRQESHTTLEIDEDEAEVIRTAARLILEEGCSLAEATRRLNALELHPRRAPLGQTEPAARTEADVLDGQLRVRQAGKPGYHRYGKHGPEIRLTVPAILSAQELGALQKALGITARGPVRNRRVYMLSGRFFGICGSTFSGVWRNDRGWRQYRCLGARHDRGRPRCEDRHRVHADFIEDLVWSEVARLLSEPDRLIAMANDFMGLHAEHVEAEQDQIAAIDGKIAALERAVANAYAEGLKAGIDSGALKRAVAELNDDLGAARRHRVQLESWRADQEAESSRMRQLWELAEAAHQRLASMTLEEKRAVLALLDVRVHVQGYDPLRVHIEGFVKDGLSLDAAREPARVGPQGLEPCPPD
jgi:hypothetical protein